MQAHANLATFIAKEVAPNVSPVVLSAWYRDDFGNSNHLAAYVAAYKASNKTAKYSVGATVKANKK